MNQLFDNNITLNRNNHTYALKTNPDFEFISVTTFIDQFFEKFEAKKIATKLVQTNRKYMDMSVEELLQKWANSAKHGTKVHEELENFILNKQPVTEIKAINGIAWLKNFLMKSNFEIYSEVVIYSQEIGISGTIDLLLFNKNENKYIIMDWKTSKNIDTKSYNKKGIKSASSNIADTKFNHYALQLSLYRYLLETYYDLEIYEHLIIHLKDYDCEGIHVPYMKNDILNMLNSK